MKQFTSLALLALAAISFAPSARAAEPPKPLKALLIVGGCCHDYTFQKRIIADGVSARAHVEFTVVQDGGSSTDAKIKLYEDPEWAKGFDVILHDECFASVKEQEWMDKVLAPHKAGTPAVLLHCAMHCYRSGTDEWFKFCGVHSTGHGPQEPISITNVDAAHPSLKATPEWTTINEELYNNVKVFDSAHPLQKGKQHIKQKDGTEKDVEAVVTWTNNYQDKTRVFATTLGHNSYTCADPRYLDMVTRGLLWACDKPADEYLKKFDAATHKFEWQDQLKPPQAKGPQPQKAPAQATPPKKDGASLGTGSSPGNGTTKENVAFNKPVTASSFQGGNETAGAVDGSFDTRWCADGAQHGEWLQVDLGKPTELTGCRIVWEMGKSDYRYRLEGSADTKAWKMLVDQTADAPPNQLHLHRFKAGDVRYVRLTVVSQKEQQWASLFELELLGTKDVPTGSSSTVDGAPAAASRASSHTDPLLSGVKVPVGYEALVFAAPPNVSYPTCLSAAPTGELYVGVDENGSLDRAPNRGKVVKCIDTDGDGRADRFQDFAKMDSPRGLIYDDGSLYVLHPPKLSVFHDTDGDGKSDTSETLVDGIGFDLNFRGADHTTNGIRLGIDGWIYIAVGDYGFIKARGKDGREQQLHGGGVARVRTDGSGLELVSVGQRNIYDVAIDPFMNLFTRDNTNDGGGWNVRLSHVVPLGNYGYPRLYMNFPGEFVEPLADYGGGSPCGALYLDEPQAFGPELGRGLYTVEWGRSGIMRHPLTPKGATFEAKEETFISVPRPTDMDVDGMGNLFISSWRDGSFTYSGPMVGYLLKVRKKDAQPEVFPDLRKQSDEELIAGIASPSGVKRLASQRELLRRSKTMAANKTKQVAEDLRKHSRSDIDLAARTAAVFTQVQFPPFTPLLTSDDFEPETIETWIRALSDSPHGRETFIQGDGPTALVATLGISNPRARLVAASAIARLDLRALNGSIVPLTADADPTVAHVAINALVQLKAIDECLKPLSDPATKPELFAGCCRVLQGLHEPKVVDGLLAALETNKSDDAKRRLVASALCRLHFREDVWDGTWWSTRPDTTGPYYKPVAWSETKRIGTALEALRGRGDAAWSDWLAVEALRNRFELSGADRALTAYMQSHPQERPAMLRLLGTKLNFLKYAGDYVASIALDGSAPIDERIAACGLLTRRANSGGLETALGTFARLDGAAIRAKPQLGTARTEFLRAVAIPPNLDELERFAFGSVPERSTLAFAVMLIMTQEANTPPAARERVNGAIEKGWKTPALTPDLLRAIALTDADAFADRVLALRKSESEPIRAAAEHAAKELRLDDRAKDAKTIAQLNFDEVQAKVLGRNGNAAVGAKLFGKQGCINCHAVAANEPPKGPFLGGIATRYPRKELVESILKPSAKIAQGFETQYVVTDDGLSQEGFIVRESGDEIELRNQNGVSKVIPKKSIEERGKRELSIMPTGLADRLTLDDLTAILAYLETLKGK
ncbi:MAG: discoidin domain-containing protein [Planctomycetia bacterium]|nr:discoidin domain-containing protein [Planctomycetia bacterium]